MIKEKSKIDFDYEVKKIYKEKSYDSLEECIKDFEFPKNSDEIYVDEKDFKIAFKDTKYIKKLAYIGILEQCFQNYLNTFCKNIF